MNQCNLHSGYSQGGCSQFSVADFSNLIKQANESLIYSKAKRYSLNVALDGAVISDAVLGQASGSVSVDRENCQKPASPVMNKNKRTVKRLSVVEKTRNDCKLENIVSEGNFFTFPAGVRNVFKEKLLKRIEKVNS
jgi:hypothetical protein